MKDSFQDIEAPSDRELKEEGFVFDVWLKDKDDIRKAGEWLIKLADNNLEDV